MLESAFDDQLPASDQTGRAPLLAFQDYELLEEIARGGMGVVYRSRQTSLNRVVAVKMMLGGHLADAADKKRFRAEAETAARLQHPNIVAIHEVGEHAGQPFFSMELVEGRNLAQMVRDEPLPPRKAATYLKTIAEAVQYAHSRGVLHRDLKPSNVLIDNSDRPRVTDFGLAKRFDSDAAETFSDLTHTGQVLGSPSFIPPEQAAGSKAEVCPASDVYSLGAILFHCLTGRPPFVAETITATLRMVAENDPVSPRLLNASVPRDLETICLKCLEKSPARRYVSAQELADDVGRFLADEPIRARQPNKAEKGWRWCRRNPAWATALLLVFVLLAGSPMVAWQISRERLQSRASSDMEREMTAFLRDMLEGVAPSMAQGRDTVLLKEILAKASERVGKELANQPEAEADVRLVIGKTYKDMGDYTNALAMTQESLRLLKAKLGPRHLKVAAALNNLGVIFSEMGDLTTAESYDREALELKKTLLGKEHPDVATSMSNLGYRLWNRGDFAGAEALHQEALRIRLKKLGHEHPDVAVSLNNLGMALWSRGNFEEAQTRFLEALAIFQKVYPGDHPNKAAMLNNVGTMLRDLGHLDEAETMNRDALAMRRRVLGERNSYTAYSQNNLGIVLQKQGQLKEAESQHLQALPILLASLGTNHAYTAEAFSALAVVVARKGDLADAEEMQHEALSISERALGKGSPGTSEALERLAVLLAVQGRLAEAGSLLTNLLSITTKASGPEHPDCISPLFHLAWVLKQEGNAKAAESFDRQARAISSKGGTYSARAMTDSHYDLAELLEGQGKFAEAQPLLLETLSFLENRPEANRFFMRRLFQRLAELYEAWDHASPDPDRSAQAAAWKEKLTSLEAKAGQSRL